MTENMTPDVELTEALLLALTAPSDEQADMAAELAERIAAGAGLDEVTVARCQRDALARARVFWEEG